MRFQRRMNRLGTRGISLVELSVVLAVVGIMLAGIWIAASRVSDMSKRERMLEDIKTTVDGVRSYYTARDGVPNVAAGTITNQLLAANAIPAGLRRPTTAGCTNQPNNLCADHPWSAANLASGNYVVCGWILGTTTACTGAPPGAVSSFFGIALLQIPQSACIAMVQNVSSTLGASGLVEVNINGTNLSTLNLPIKPVTTGDAEQYCLRNNPATAAFVYRLGESAP